MCRAVPVTIALVLLAAPAQASFPGTPSSVAFTSAREGGGLFAAPADLGSVSRFETPFAGARQPAWSPDGSQLAYAATGPDGSLDVLVASTSGTTVVAAGAGDQQQPAFAPDGRRIVFVREAGDGYGGGAGTELAIIGVDGSDERLLATAPGVKGEPAWSPDGRRIAFTIRGPGSAGTDLAVVTPRGEQLTRVTSDAGAETGPDWAPDATSLVYSDDGTLTRVSGASAPAVLLPGGTDTAPAHAPDGTRIVFARDVGGEDGLELHTVTPGGSELRRITRSPGADTEPAWRALPVAAPAKGVPVLRARLERSRVRRALLLRGTLTMPAGVSVREGCRGRVSASRLSGARRLPLRRTTLRRRGSRCTFAANVRVRRGQRLLLRFGGNDRLVAVRRTFRLR